VLHLKSAVTALPDGTFVTSDAARFDPAPFPTMRLVPEEAGSHVVLVGDGAMLMAASAPRSAEMFDDLGFDVVTVDIGEFEKREGCVTCLSVLVAGRDE
jgi:dimethylargininase